MSGACCARSLRDAAEAARGDLANEIGSGHTTTFSVRRWLSARADRIEEALAVAEGDGRVEIEAEQMERMQALVKRAQARWLAEALRKGEW
jgi:hypothetical protein